MLRLSAGLGRGRTRSDTRNAMRAANPAYGDCMATVWRLMMLKVLLYVVVQLDFSCESPISPPKGDPMYFPLKANETTSVG